MIHGAKLLNKKKIRKVLCAKKNKKNQKKIFIKIEKRQRSGKLLKTGCGLSFAQTPKKTDNNTRTARTYRIYIAPLVVYNMRVIRENGFLSIFVRRARFYLTAWAFVPS